MTSRRYFVRKSSTTPDADSSALHGGFKYLSRFSGSSRPLKRAALRSICFTSLTRPLHRSHRGDSGTTNLVVNENKAIPSLCCHNRVYYRSRYFNLRDTKTSVVTNFFRSFSSPRVEYVKFLHNSGIGRRPVMSVDCQKNFTRVTFRV